MQKVIKPVTKLFLLFLLLNNAHSQTINDDYILLNKVIELSNSQKKNNYKLLKFANLNNDKLYKYYKFKYDNKPIYKVVIGYDEQTDSLIYEDNENLKSRDSIWTLKYAIIDSLFTKKDIEFCLQRDKNQLLEWDTSRIIHDNVTVSNDTTLSFGNIIYRPYYTVNGKYSIVMHKSAKTFTSFYIFKKENEDWIIIDSIENIW